MFDALEDRTVMASAIGLEPVSGLSGLTNTLFLTSARDGTNRLFAVEQGGRILVRQPNGSVSVFLNISPTASNPADRRVVSGGEQGLLGLAFHPQFATNGLFYVHHTRAGLTNTNDIVEYRVNPANPNVADPASERLLLRIPQPFANHNGGSIAFGPDGLLYIGKGDGGSSNDPNGNAQNINSLLGKILRIDVNRDDFPSDPQRNYGIPSSNPYVGVPGADEIFALGLRNPYRFSFDRGTGQLYVGDVGQSAREEVDIVTLGGNYGWRAFEGNIPTPGINTAEGDAIRSVAIFPITDLNRTLAQSITGGYVYRGTQGTLPTGSYLFGDYITGNIFLLQNGTRITLMGAGFNVASFGEDEAGELYVVRYGTAIYKVVPSSTNQPPSLGAIADRAVPASQDVATVPLSANDPNGDAISFAAGAQSLAYVLDQQLGLKFNGDEMLDWGGRSEKWLLGSLAWYFILPNGELYRWDGSSQATGTLVGVPGASYYSNLSLLYDAQANQPHAAVSVAGSTLTIDRDNGFVGAVVTTVLISDGRGGFDTRTFTLSTTVNPPVLAAIANRTVPSNQDVTTVSLSATDLDNDPISFSATAQSLAYVLDQQLGLKFNGDEMLDWGGRSEKWLLGSLAWYFILPNGELYRWDGSSQATGTLVGVPGASYYSNLSLLYDAQANQPHAAVSIMGSTLTLDRDNGFIGAVVVTVTASEPTGLSDKKTFAVIVTA